MTQIHGTESDGIGIDAATRARIGDFLASYAHAIDDGEVERWPDFFTEDGRYHLATRESHAAGLPIGIITDNSRAMLRDRVAALREANIYEPHVYNHLLGPAVLQATAEGWRARSNFQVVRTMQDGRADLFATGRYFDRVVAREGRLLFAERLVLIDSRRIDILLVLPL
ncbi:aromatic-ring-hydroxylating dioxygenase subunit beta [Xanthobacter sp. V4C-4]|uniref:aromatic-ring-hydroxylating dioxygenase subunit beta n=1 Tax=Xanthobacter cornucopiae TaxID=3119924 RepID=UPI00372B516B